MCIFGVAENSKLIKPVVQESDWIFSKSFQKLRKKRGAPGTV